MALDFLKTEMGQGINVATKEIEAANQLSKEEKEMYSKRFDTLDEGKKGYISITDLRRGLQVNLLL